MARLHVDAGLWRWTVAARSTRRCIRIFGVWLPASGYVLDDREHFEVLPADYRPDDPNAREEVWNRATG